MTHPPLLAPETPMPAMPCYDPRQRSHHANSDHLRTRYILNRRRMKAIAIGHVGDFAELETLPHGASKAYSDYTVGQHCVSVHRPALHVEKEHRQH